MPPAIESRPTLSRRMNNTSLSSKLHQPPSHSVKSRPISPSSSSHRISNTSHLVPVHLIKTGLTLASTLGLTQAQVNGFRTVFSFLDVDLGGTVSKDELLQRCEELDIVVDRASVEDAMKDIDPQNSENITFESFIRYMTSHEKYAKTIKSSVAECEDAQVPKEALLFVALTKFIDQQKLTNHQAVGSDNAEFDLQELELYYCQKAKKFQPHVLGDFVAGCRLIGMTDHQFEKRINELKRISILTNKKRGLSSSPYAKIPNPQAILDDADRIRVKNEQVHQRSSTWQCRSLSPVYPRSGSQLQNGRSMKSTSKTTPSPANEDTSHSVTFVAMLDQQSSSSTVSMPRSTLNQEADLHNFMPTPPSRSKPVKGTKRKQAQELSSSLPSSTFKMEWKNIKGHRIQSPTLKRRMKMTLNTYMGSGKAV
eukprot:m.86858 g.86858  ORF g.86858 m.86858 type:complete len:424 (-) comp8773_c1_seq2:171-1442(-)